MHANGRDQTGSSISHIIIDSGTPDRARLHVIPPGHPIEYDKYVLHTEYPVIMISLRQDLPVPASLSIPPLTPVPIQWKPQ